MDVGHIGCREGEKVMRVELACMERCSVAPVVQCIADPEPTEIGTSHANVCRRFRRDPVGPNQ